MKKRLAVFASGSGSDFQSVIDAVERGEINASIALLVASKPDIGAVERAARHGISVAVYQKKDYADPAAMFAAISAFLRTLFVDYIVLAGYLTILTPNIVRDYRDRIVNIHPSLIPKYCGDGFYGIRVHRAALENGEAYSGATVHLVDEGTDTGRILAQERVPILPDDTPETLQARVLALEHTLLPRTLAALCAE